MIVGLTAMKWNEIWTCLNIIIMFSCKGMVPIFWMTAFAYLNDEEILMNMQYVAQRKISVHNLQMVCTFGNASMPI